MKIIKTENTNKFQPITITLEIESMDDLLTFAHKMNTPFEWIKAADVKNGYKPKYPYPTYSVQQYSVHDRLEEIIRTLS